MRSKNAVAGLLTSLIATTAFAKPHELKVPLHDGRLRAGDLSSTVLSALRLPPVSVPAGEIDFRGVAGTRFVLAMNDAFGDGCRLEVGPSFVALHVDPDKLPKNVNSSKLAARLFVAALAPGATADQAAEWGLHLPRKFDPAEPLVVLVHGLDQDAGDWSAVAALLDASGRQSATFCYPCDGPADDDVRRMTTAMTEFHTDHPTTPIDVVAFSLGALVSRGYIEGPNYAGNVGHFILLAPPNHGSAWASYTLISKLREQFDQAVGDSKWSASWFVTSGLCEAGDDLLPGSPFLTRLNANPRRAGVAYTIIQGDQNPFTRVLSGYVAMPVRWTPTTARQWWGVRQTDDYLLGRARRLRDQPGNSDGPVSLDSALLPGVTDVVRVHADHETILHGDDAVPASWPTLRDRLKIVGRR